MSEIVAPKLLMAVPNVSDGRHTALLEAIEHGFAPARFLDIHADPDHNRSVYTLAAPQGELAEGLVAGARAVVEAVDITLHGGVHPYVGALDVMPVVYRSEAQRGPATAELLTAAARIGDELGLPVVLYGELATAPEHRERAWLRDGGAAALARRIESGDVVPDYGPRRAHPTAGVLLAAVRPPLVAFNVDLATPDLDAARRIAADIRESGGAAKGRSRTGTSAAVAELAGARSGEHRSQGLPGVRAIGLWLEQRGCAQVSTNVHDHLATPLGAIVEAVRAQAPVAEAELVGLAPEAAFDGFPRDVPLRGFTPERHVLENALAALS